MKIVTSFSSKNIERQLYCVNTWRRYDLPIVGVQTEGESDLLKEHFPFVTFVETSLGGDAFNKPHLPRITELIKQANDDSILIINSDISIEDTKQEFIDNWEGDGLICGIRLNHRKYGINRVKRNPFGIDAFKVPMGTEVPDYGFAIGVPGWDYFLPYELNLRGMTITVSPSKLLHLIHDLNYEDKYIKIAQQLLVATYGYDQRHFTETVQKLTNRVRQTYRNCAPQDFTWRNL